jgi:hypothetical protein
VKIVVVWVDKQRIIRVAAYVACAAGIVTVFDTAISGVAVIQLIPVVPQDTVRNSGRNIECPTVDTIVRIIYYRVVPHYCIGYVLVEFYTSIVVVYQVILDNRDTLFGKYPLAAIILNDAISNSGVAAGSANYTCAVVVPDDTIAYG